MTLQSTYALQGTTGVDRTPSRQDEGTASPARVFSLTQRGSDVEAAFTVAREKDMWSDRDDIALKDAFIVANRPKGVSAEHFIRWAQEVIDNPGNPEVPQHHLEAVMAVVNELQKPDGLAVAIECSWSEATLHLWELGQEIKRGKPRPQVYKFIGSQPNRGQHA